MNEAPRQTVLLHVVFGAILFGAYAFAEELLWSRFGGVHPLILARVSVAGLIGGVGLGLVGAAADWSRRAMLGPKIGAVLVAGSLAVAIVSAVRVGDTYSILAIVAVLGLAALIARRLTATPDARGQVVALIGPYVVLGVIAAFGAAWIEYAPDRSHRAEGLVRLLMMAWTAAIVGAYFYGLVGAQRRVRGLAVVLPVLGLLTISWMPSWFFGLMVALKVCALIYVTLVIGLLTHSAMANPRAVRLAAVVVATFGMLGAVVLRVANVGDRFGPLDTYSLVGMAMVVVSTDADGDTYFDAADGGTDPDDTDPARRPTDHLQALTAPAPPTDVRATHAIVIIADAMRADATYGLDDAFLNTDPSFVRFTRAYSPSNTTNVSVPAILDGSAPGPPDSPTEPLFAAVASANPHFAVLTDLEQVWQPDRFAVAPDQFSHSSNADAEHSYAAHALAWLKQRHRAGAGETLSVVYLSDPHAPYVCAGGRVGGYDCYLDELRRIDGLVRQLCEYLRTEGLLDQTLLIVTADHGEEFGEHGFDNHSTNLFEPQIHVPLVLRAPGVVGREVVTPVSNAGTAATVREVLGAPAPAHGYPSLLALATGVTSTYPTPVAHHWEDERHDIRIEIRKSAFIEAEQKLIVDWRTGYVLLLRVEGDRPLDERLRERELRNEFLGEQWPPSPTTEP